MKYLLCGLIVFSILMKAQTADEIIANNIETTGGYANWKSLKSVQLNAKAVLSINTEYDVQIMQQFPNFTKTLIQMNGKKIISELYDGKNGYTYDFVLSKLLKNSSYTPEYFESDLLDYQKKGFSANKITNAKMNNTDCFRIVLSKNNLNTTYWFQTKTFELLKEENTKEVILYSDYKKVQKWFFPFRIISKNLQDKEDYNLLIYQIIPNINFDKKTFIK